MSFTQPVFLLFLALVYFLYWRLTFRKQNWLIFIASVFFYGWWDWRFLGLLFFTATVDYYAALRLNASDTEATRKWLLGLSVASNLAVLGFFKYFNFFATSLHSGMKTLGLSLDLPMLEVVLPLGISFYTFQALSYTIDVYRRELPAVRDYVQYMCFITFFPHMVAGPIQQATHFLVQFERPRCFQWNESIDGARQMLWGFFKKLVVADTLAPLVEASFGNPAGAPGSDLLWATYFFAFQIYCDFSGYTDIAIGCAKLFNFQLSRNFAYPYFSSTIPEFWGRWHIALSDWFRRYLYIPLGGNRVGRKRWMLNILIVFLVSGLWHGANWTFVIWGLLHGVLFLVFTHFTSESLLKNPVTRVVLGIVTFHLVCFAWVFFRAETLPDAIVVLQKVGGSLLSFELAKPVSSKAVQWISRFNGSRVVRAEDAPWPGENPRAETVALGFLLRGCFNHYLRGSPELHPLYLLSILMATLAQIPSEQRSSDFGRSPYGRPKFERALLLFFLPIALLVAIGEVILWKCGETWSFTRIIKYQTDHPDALFMRGVLDQGFYGYKMLQLEERTPKIIALGSSRVMEFRREMFGARAKEFYNGGGLLQDFSDLQAYAERLSNNVPEVILLGIDLWWFNEALKFKEGLRLHANYDAATDWQAHVKGLRALRSSRARKPAVRAIKSNNNHVGLQARATETGFRPDGSMQYHFTIPTNSSGWRFIDRETPPVAERIRKGEAQFLPDEGGFEKRLALLDSSVALLVRKGALVVGVLPPFSEESAKLLQSSAQHSNLWLYVHNKVPALFRARNLPTLDASQTSHFGVSDSYMIDGMHAAETFHLHMLTRLLNDETFAAHFEGLRTHLNTVLNSPKTNPWQPDYTAGNESINR